MNLNRVESGRLRARSRLPKSRIRVCISASVSSRGVAPNFFVGIGEGATGGPSIKNGNVWRPQWTICAASSEPCV